MTKCFRYGSVARRLFKKRWGIDKGLTQDHHVIPRKFRHHEVLKRTGYDMNSSHNLVIMPTHYGMDKLNIRQDRLIHYGGHPKYDRYVFSILEVMEQVQCNDTLKTYLNDYVVFLKKNLRNNEANLPWN